MAYYVFPDIAEEICACIQQNFEEGVYADIDESDFFAYALTTHIQKVSQDKHLWIRWHPELVPEYEGSLLQSPENIEEFKQRAKLDNYGIHKVERLPGNIGIIDIRYFFRTSWGSGETIVAAMNFLANMNAIIVDLRKCTGGNPGAVAMICSYFFADEPIHLNSLYWRPSNRTDEFWTLKALPGKRYPDVDLYVLTSNRTFSGAEEFTYNMKNLKRATIVGETTGGGAHPVNQKPVDGQFVITIPVGRAINPISKTNWEGVGVKPDIEVARDDALATAHLLALRKIHERTRDEEWKSQLQRYIRQIERDLAAKK